MLPDVFSNPNEVKAETRAGTGCGSCIPELKMMLAEETAEDAGEPVAATT